MGDDPVGRALAEVLSRATQSPGGILADYIPEPATADKNSFAISAASVSGHVYSAGDDDVTFTMGMLKAVAERAAAQGCEFAIVRP